MLFNKVIAFTDIHLGHKANSNEHNEDCIQFIKWMISKAKEQNIETCLFLGDWHHNRQTVNVETLNYSYEAMKLLNDNFKETYFIVGNHDLYFRDNRDISSLIYARDLENIIYIDEKYSKDDVVFYPWLVGDEWKEIRNSKHKYVFGHFELPDFYLNSMVKMPDTGELKDDDFQKTGHVFTGHFHKRQTKGNVTYIGNAFPHDFNDVWDDERGVMILEWDKEPEYYNWPDAPKYRRYEYNMIKDNPDKVFKGVSKLHLKIDYDESDVTYSEVSTFRDTLIESYDIRTIKLLSRIDAGDNEGVEVEEAATCDSVDTIVVEQIKSMDSGEYDPKYLIDIYNEL